MKKRLEVFLILMMLIFTSCSMHSKEKDAYFYLGKSNTWLVTYSVTKVASSYYDSLSIQYIFDNNEDNLDKIGPIEYQLSDSSRSLVSSFPQQLQGIGYFHAGSRMNADIFKITFDKEMVFAIQWQGNTEKFKLNRQD